MNLLDKTKRLKRELNLLDIYAIATGSTIAGGFFLIPGLAAILTGQALILSYIIAALLLIPSILSLIELSTAMPRAGGIYYFLDRSLGPLVGTIGGLGVWLTLILKVAFALVGIAAYSTLFFPQFDVTPISIVLALILTLVNFVGAKKSGKFQVILVAGLLLILTFFIAGGAAHINFSRFDKIFDFEFSNLMATAGLVFISYVGVTKIASVSEEIKNPERNIPLGIFLALGTAFLVYTLGTIVMVGVLPFENLVGNLTAAASAAETFMGKTGIVIISLAALFSFLSVANAGILSASRYPLAMSRDHIMPAIFRRLSKNNTPYIALAGTFVIIALALLAFDPTKIAKLASAFQLLIFAFICIAVIVMRESKIHSYDPGYKAPFYPWFQIIGIIASLWLIFEMGFLPSAFSIGLIIIGIIWYRLYAKDKVIRNGAIYHIFERLGQQRYQGLDSELRSILKEKGLRQGDPFDEIVLRSRVVELPEETDFDNLVAEVSKWLEKILPLSSRSIRQQILDGTRVGATPVTHGVALPHFRVDGIDHPEMVLVRSKPGVHIGIYNPLTHEEETKELVHAIFFLISPEKDPTLHLRILAQIAGRVDENSFMQEWSEAKDEQELKEALLHDDAFFSLYVGRNTNSEELIGKKLSDINMPKGSLVALLRRGSDIIVPKGWTTLEEGDRMTIIGDPASIKFLREKYSDNILS